MPKDLSEKSSVEKIRERFDQDVERFSNLQTGQSATIDAPLAMELITQAAVAATPNIERILDLGCGAGNNTLKLLEHSRSVFDCDLCDLSKPMLERARQRVSAAAAGAGEVSVMHGDFRTLEIESERYDIILAAAVLHHLRDDADWEQAFAKIFRILKPSGSVWITDLVTHSHPAVHALMWERYRDYLVALDSEAYANRVFAYIDEEDSPRSVTYQLDLLKRVGFSTVELLHKNSCFAAFGAVK